VNRGVFLFSAIFIPACILGCATKKNSLEAAQQKQLAPAYTHPPALSFLLSNETLLLKDSEFSILFFEEYNPNTRTVSVRAHQMSFEILRAQGASYTKTNELDSLDYRDFIARLRQLDEQSFREIATSRCHEPYKIKLRVGKEERDFKGCRGQDNNASVVSKLARDVEFVLLKKLK